MTMGPYLALEIPVTFVNVLRNIFRISHAARRFSIMHALKCSHFWNTGCVLRWVFLNHWVVNGNLFENVGDESIPGI